MTDSPTVRERIEAVRKKQSKRKLRTDAKAAAIFADLKAHDRGCRYRLAVGGAAAIECPHGYDACPTCDPCTCSKVEEAK